MSNQWLLFSIKHGPNSIVEKCSSNIRIDLLKLGLCMNKKIFGKTARPKVNLFPYSSRAIVTNDIILSVSRDLM